MPKFTIITPSYNSWSLMTKYWNSLENQSNQDCEIIIIDDRSKDDTYSRLIDYAESSSLDIKILRNTENHGLGYTRNRGIDKASGEWITFIDSDDSIDCSLLEKVAIILSSNYCAVVPIKCLVYDYYSVKGEALNRAASIYGITRGGDTAIIYLHLKGAKLYLGKVL